MKHVFLVGKRSVLNVGRAGNRGNFARIDADLPARLGLFASRRGFGHDRWIQHPQGGDGLCLAMGLA